MMSRTDACSVIVTGGASGIGRSVAELLLERWEKARVALVDSDAKMLPDPQGPGARRSGVTTAGQFGRHGVG